MPLKVELKPGERVLIGESVITNGDHRARFLVEGDQPILREKDIMTPGRADTQAKRIYLTVQCMYTARDPRPYHEEYFGLIRDLVQAAPSTWNYVETINNHILTGELYKAMKQAKQLVEYEKDLIAHAKRGRSVRESS
jgi:flagellar protein FlbT